MSISEQHLKVRNGLSLNPIFSIYSASMVAVFCALITMVEARVPALFALLALLISYLFTCIFVFGGFRGVLSQSEGGYRSQFQLGLPNGFVLLFCVASLAALFGTYSALGPIAGSGVESTVFKTGGVTQRSKGASSPVAKGVRQKVVASSAIRSASDGKSGVLAPMARSKTAVSRPALELPEPTLASVRSDDLFDTRTIRSRAWAIRASADLPVLLRLPEVLFSILYGDDNTPAVEPNMVVAKQNNNSTARIMVSFLTAPHSSFKNLPAAKTGGIVVVQKRETVVALRPARVTTVEPVTVVQKTAAPDRAASTTVVIAQGDTPSLRPDPVGVASTKQDVQRVVRGAPQKSASKQPPNLLLPPVLASIFYGRPSAALDPSTGEKRAPRLTTLFKTAAPQGIPLTSTGAVTVVAKKPEVSQERHPIALAALADKHRILQARSDGLGGPFSKVTGAIAKQAPQPALGDLVTGSISPREIDAAIRSLRFVPSFAKKAQQIEKTNQSVEQSDKKDLGKAAVGRISSPKPAGGAGTVVLKSEVSAAVSVPRTQKIALAPPTAGARTTEAFKLADVGPSSAGTPTPETRPQVSPIKISADGNTFVQKTSSASAGKVKLDLNSPRPVADDAQSQSKPQKAAVSPEAMRRANEEINSVLRGAEADLKATDLLLDEIDVIWSDHDNNTRPSKAKAKTKVKLEPLPAQKKIAVVINPASEVLIATTEQRKQDALPKAPVGELVALLSPSPGSVELALDESGLSRGAKAPSGSEQQLLGYIREQGSLDRRSSFTECAVVGSDSKLRSCSGRFSKL